MNYMQVHVCIIIVVLYNERNLLMQVHVHMISLCFDHCFFYVYFTHMYKARVSIRCAI